MKRLERIAVMAVLALTLVMVAGCTSESLREPNGALVPVDAEPSSYISLGPGYYLGVQKVCGSGDTIDWYFTSTGSRIKVLACTSAQYAGSPTTNYYAMLADLSYGASGTFAVPSTDTWYIVLYNDAITTTAEVTYTITHHAKPVVPVIPGFIEGFLAIGFLISTLGIIAISSKRHTLHK